MFINKREPKRWQLHFHPQPLPETQIPMGRSTNRGEATHPQRLVNTDLNQHRSIWQRNALLCCPHQTTSLLAQKPFKSSGTSCVNPSEGLTPYLPSFLMCSQLLDLNSLLALTPHRCSFLLVSPLRAQSPLTPESLGHCLAHNNNSINLKNGHPPPLLHQMLDM